MAGRILAWVSLGGRRPEQDFHSTLDSRFLLLVSMPPDNAAAVSLAETLSMLVNARAQLRVVSVFCPDRIPVQITFGYFQSQQAIEA